MDSLENKLIEIYMRDWNEMTLNKLSEEMDTIQGSWNGDNAGVEEDRAGQADEVHGKLNELRELLEGFYHL